MAHKLTIILLLLVVLAICCSSHGAYAFGAGNIPGFAYMEGRAFRHGDIEDVLADLLKKAGGGFSLGALVGKGGSKFGGLDIKRVYFGNWLRDYSQAVDIAGLKKLPLQTIINLCMVLGFLAHGYVTGEFEVTAERLGVYLPTEHIDNPKGYGEGEDARKYHPKLRGPVDPRELEVDPRTGMKNYIANEAGSWDTSKALVRRTLERCIHLGRQHRSQGRKEDEYEAYRLLGQALHTLEDFPAHSNFCELALVSLGHRDVFVHVGDQVRLRAPNGQQVAPLVTGTFGGSDFIHSLLGEATDHISQASVTDLNKALDSAKSRSVQDRGGSPANTLRDLLFKLPGADNSEMSREMDGIERIRAGPAQGGKRPEDMSPQEMYAVLWQVLSFRDSVVKKIEKTIEKIPGLGPLIEKLMDSIQVFIFTTLEPFLKPLLKTATSGLQTASGEVIDTHDQYEVFNDPRASDPTHSFLSKDHFNLILNEPAGNLAKIIVKHTASLVVRAWDDTSMNVQHVTSDILECLFHPDFHDSNSKIQREMLQYMRDWSQGHGGRTGDVIRRLSKNAVRNHENIRLAGEGGVPEAQGTAAYNYGQQAQHDLQGYLNQIPGVSQAQHFVGQFSNSGPGGRREGGPSFGEGPGYTPPQRFSSAPVPSSGESASYFQGGSSQPAPHSSFGQPAPSFPGSESPFAPPAGAPPSSGPWSSPAGGPSFPSAPPSMPFSGAPPAQSGYAPSYQQYPPSFPGAEFPGGGGGYGGFAPPPGPPGPGFPGAAPGFPDAGGPPGFPSAHNHGHHGHHPHGPPGGSGYGGSGW
ncbi:Het-C-domain-containing protein [Punctularia strigosozonata HHB-11173 SS5]|uniref:Het-C-domain-containing protein n=1 Tax=Punctularia strigosozonata (strain HHB-11173) TaxID=741275 RepID=UPI000441660F|nr:Het-C-domain-containing protein [Punctularia strigosozonata HHB-11173 SS5]EIN08362.1 Het-C-domain-containing protein [Punctularia strigosozonata HHB-11173 SS5]